jgi:transposase
VRYLGMDVHAKSTVWCLLDAQGEVVSQGRVETSAPALGALVRELSITEEVVAGQEVGTMTYLVHDTVTAAGASVLSFNAHQLRMIAASRKKTDRRDAYWIAKALQSGMYPHPVYIPSGEIRALRALLSRRQLLQAEHKRWRCRARAYLRAAGCPAPRGAGALRMALRRGTPPATGDVVPLLADAVALCQRQEGALRLELQRVDAALVGRTRSIAAIGRLMTVPGIGSVAATTLYAWVGDVCRFPNAKALGAYAGLVPSVRQSGGAAHYGEITKQGSRMLRATLVQAAHVLLSRCRGPEAGPLQAIGTRIRTSRGRRKIAVVAMARHLLRLGYYLLRDGTTYDPQRVRGPARATAPAA